MIYKDSRHTYDTSKFTEPQCESVIGLQKKTIDFNKAFKPTKAEILNKLPLQIVEACEKRLKDFSKEAKSTKNASTDSTK